MTDQRADDLAFARRVLYSEVEAIASISERLGDSFSDAVELILACRGRVVVTGIGKAGIIGQKISATLASTGTPSHSLHPVEALHGDLGRIVRDDVVVALSNSGETEVVALLPSVKRIGARIIAVTGNANSTLARHADVVLDIGHIQEACPLGLAPSASTTAMLALGDALALTVARRRHFREEDYALFHPGGELGRRLMKVEEIMRSPGDYACVTPDVTVRSALASSPKRAGAICIVDASGRLTGIFTDGDLRRSLVRGADVLDARLGDVMTRDPKRISIGRLAQEAAKIMEDSQIDELPVVDSAGVLRGVIDVQDLLLHRLLSP